MKYVKYILLTLLVLVVIFFAMGLIKSSVAYESEVTINKPVEEAWAIMSDESRISEWLKEIKSYELISGTANTVGAVSKVTISQNGEDMVMEETITAIEPNKYMAMTFTMDFMNMDYEMFFSERDGGTHILTKSKTVGNGLFAKSLLAFMGNAMQKQEDENLGNLKKLIESNTKNYFAAPADSTAVSID